MASFLQPSTQPNESGPTASMKSSELQTALEVETISKNAVNDSAKSTPGVFLTWDDLWVTVPNRKHGSKPILQGLTGYAQPGELLAIMGPSGCGKSTLLDALAGNKSMLIFLKKIILCM
jgi:ABC-type multidrug transport system ATPase subunit